MYYMVVLTKQMRRFFFLKIYFNVLDTSTSKYVPQNHPHYQYGIGDAAAGKQLIFKWVIHLIALHSDCLTRKIHVNVKMNDNSSNTTEIQNNT